MPDGSRTFTLIFYEIVNSRYRKSSATVKQTPVDLHKKSLVTVLFANLAARVRLIPRSKLAGKK